MLEAIEEALDSAERAAQHFERQQSSGTGDKAAVVAPLTDDSYSPASPQQPTVERRQAQPEPVAAENAQHADASGHLLTEPETLIEDDMMLEATEAAATVGDASERTAGSHLPQAIEHGRAETAQSVLPGSAGVSMAVKWQSFVSRLRSAVKRRLPDLQALLALHASLEAHMQQRPARAKETQVYL